MFPHLVGDPQGVVDPESSPPIPLFSLRGQLALPTCCVPGSDRSQGSEEIVEAPLWRPPFQPGPLRLHSARV